MLSFRGCKIAMTIYDAAGFESATQGLKKEVFRVQPDDYGWQQDEYKLQN